MKDLFGNDIKERQKVHIRNSDGSYKANPMVTVYGLGPENTRCKQCKHFYYKRYSKKYFKCDYRRDTNSPVTDHRANWPACAKFEME